MSEYIKTIYNFNNRFKLNDDITDTTKFALVDPRAFMDTIANNIEEEKPTEPGIIDYGVKFGKGIAQIPLTLYASTDSNMSQLVQNLKTAFNPDLLELDPTYGESTDFGGYHPLDWTEVVGGVTRNFRIYMKSTETPAVVEDPIAGLILGATLKLKARDPRKYLQSESTLLDAGTATNDGTYPTPINITITASGATSTSLTITNFTTGKSIVVSTALANTDVLVIDTFYHSVKLNGVEKKSMISNASDWWTLLPGDNTITTANSTNTSITFTWRSAWPL